MSEQEYQHESGPENSPENSEIEEQELSFSDKLVGVFTEPTATYEKISKFPPKLVDWLVPYLLFLVIFALSNMLLMRNPEIKYQVKQKQIETMNKRLTEEVQAKKITTQQAEEQKAMIEKQFEMMDSGFYTAISFVSIVIFGFIVIIVVVGYFYLFSKFIFKEGTSFTQALVANGLTSYIGILSVILATILAMVLNRHIKDVSVASLLNTETGTFMHFVLDKLNVFVIWSYFVFSIGLAKMFNSTNVKKYYALVFGSWIGWALLFFILAMFVPFFKSFAGQ